MRNLQRQWLEKARDNLKRGEYGNSNKRGNETEHFVPICQEHANWIRNWIETGDLQGLETENSQTHQSFGLELD